ncbi:MAG: serine/threonine-protein kinase [Nakamurella sp.]
MGADDEPAETSAFSPGDGPDDGPEDRTAAHPPPGQRAPRQGGGRPPLEPTQPYGGPADPTPAVVPGIVLDNRYRLEALLGRGATAEVYRGLDELLGRQVAVKVFHRGLGDANSVARQRTEMQVLAKLHHPHLITVYDARLGVDHGDGPNGPDDADLTYLVMELIDGGTLADRITPTGMPPVDVARVGAAVAGALAAVHSHDLVHRDVKPANILISTTGDVKLSDFGIARELAAARLTAAADVIGTAAYLSPEQARGAEVGPPTDVYALGLVLLESLTGHREYPGAAIESAVARLLRDPLVPANLPGSWSPLLRAMTQSDPARRPTAGEVEAALTGRGDIIGAPPATATLPQPVRVIPPPPTAKPKSGAGRTFAITLLILAVTAGVIVGIVALIQRNSTTQTPVVTTPSVSSTSSEPSVVTTTERTTETTRESTTSTSTPSSTSTSKTPTTSSNPPTTPTTPSTPTTPTIPPGPTAPATLPTDPLGNTAPVTP